RVFGTFLLVGMDGLGARDQLYVGPQVLTADLDDVIGFLPESTRDGPVAVHGDVHEGDPQAKVLYVGDDLSQVFFRADHERVADRVVARQRGQVAVNLGF